ncbi:MAG: Sensor histidine kinase ResE [Alphaproteobacteria bacterium MarineAlpha9_Bin4]|nr:MAG: Sensor histidine kinase ResE [Alphaproteobacteria bacterium MarineAlpha9_Bin4]
MFRAKYLIIVLFFLLLYALAALLYLSGRYESATIIIISTSILFFLQTLRMYFFFKHLIEYFAKDNIYIQPTLYNFFLNPKNEILRIKASLERKNQLLNSELQETKNNYSKLIDSIPLPIIIINEKKFILFTNKFAKKAFSLELEKSFLYEHFRNFDITDDIIKEEINSKEFQFNHEIEGQSISYKVLLQSLFSEKTNSSTFLLIFIDQSQISKSIQERNDFLTNASHELKTPLTNILGISEIVCNDPDTLIKNRTFGKNLLLNVKRMQSLINSLLDLSKIEINRNIIQYKTLNLVTLVQATINEFKNMNSKKKNIKFFNNLDSRTFKLKTDDKEFKLLFFNLLDNSFKYDSSYVKVFLEKKKDNIEILFQDDGKGIPKNEIHRITERFYRVKGNEKIEGNGLGLAIAKEIMNNHNGEIKIKSEKGKGTKVFLIF